MKFWGTSTLFSHQGIPSSCFTSIAKVITRGDTIGRQIRPGTVRTKEFETPKGCTKAWMMPECLSLEAAGDGDQSMSVSPHFVGISEAPFRDAICGGVQPW